MRHNFEANEAKAREPGVAKGAAGADDGKALLRRTVARYKLDEFYRTPSAFGSQMVIWLPEAAWAKLTSSERESLKAYVSSSYANWGIGVGRVSGRDVLADRIVLQH